MPLFFFDVNDAVDGEGLHFPTAHAAREEAARSLPAMMSDAARVSTGECRGWKCVVRDDGGKSLFRVTVAMFVEDISEPPTGVLRFRPV